MSDNEEEIAQKVQKQLAQKFAKATKAYKHLEKLFKDKVILPTDKPSDISQKDVLFQEFCSQFNKLKSIHGVCTKEGKQSPLQNILPMSSYLLQEI